MSESNSFVVACIPAYNKEKNIGVVMIRTREYVDGALVLIGFGVVSVVLVFRLLFL
jgi:hypothetical protein